jgi:hypothetical protein
LYAAQEASLSRSQGGKLIKECRETEYPRKDVKDENIAKKLCEGSEKLIERVEREEAVRRALQKKEKEEAEKSQKAGEDVKEKSENNGNATQNKNTNSRRQRKAK